MIVSACCHTALAIAPPHPSFLARARPPVACFRTFCVRRKQLVRPNCRDTRGSCRPTGAILRFYGASPSMYGFGRETFGKETSSGGKLIHAGINYMFVVSPLIGHRCDAVPYRQLLQGRALAKNEFLPDARHLLFSPSLHNLRILRHGAAATVTRMTI